jgi:hypothetical protein
MSFQPFESNPTQSTEEAKLHTQKVVVQKLPFHQPVIGKLRHISRMTGQGGKSKEYDSYDDNRT